MIAPAVIGLLMAAELPSSLENRGDAAAEAYVQCLFGVVRQSNAAHLSQSAFEERLAQSCHREEDAYRTIAMRILKMRGQTELAQLIDQRSRQTRQAMIEDYRSLPEKQRLFEQLNALCTANPQACQQ
jgi:hypothetical protein